MNKCPKCGASLSVGLKYTFVCGTSELTAGGYDDGKECLRRQLAAVTAERDRYLRALRAIEHELAHFDPHPFSDTLDDIVYDAVKEQ